jgi:hypothetical protein
MARKTNHTGRSKGSGQFVMLDFGMLNSSAWGALTPAERSVLICVAKRYSGSNNGRIAAPCRAIAAEAGINKDTVGNALKRLCEHGFLDLMQAGAFSLKVRHAAEYRLTWRGCDRTGAPASRRFKHWRPEAGDSLKAAS